MSAGENVAMFVLIFGPWILFGLWVWWMERRFDRWCEELRKRDRE